MANSPHCLLLDQVTIVPFQNLSFACYDQEGLLIKEALLFRTFGSPFKVAPPPKSVVEHKGEVIFAGFFFKQYGHFLLESLARLWYAKDHPDLPIAFVGRDGLILDFQAYIFKLLGLKNEFIFVDQSVRFAKVHLPSPGFISQGLCYPWQVEFLGQYPKAHPLSSKAIYLSRKRFGGDSGLLNENELEKALKSQGIHIFYPEEHPLEIQLQILNNASQILALEGSALHTLILLKEVKSQVVIIPRPNQRPNLNYLGIAQAKGFQQCYLPAKDLYDDLQTLKDSHLNFTAKLNIERLLSYLSSSWEPYSLYANLYLKHPEIIDLKTDPAKKALARLEEQNSILKAKISALSLENKKLQHYLTKVTRN
ncbi:MAG: glycosyltransferase family 61 protein [Desulfovibrionaceae bacterium]|nr:glycosyltransferase family 61 protein [Desulfovibrionaceae bacterium]